MQCRSTGNPTPKIYWLKDGKRLEMNQRYTLIDGKFVCWTSIFSWHQLFNLFITEYGVIDTNKFTTQKFGSGSESWDVPVLFFSDRILINYIRWP